MYAVEYSPGHDDTLSEGHESSASLFNRRLSNVDGARANTPRRDRAAKAQVRSIEGRRVLEGSTTEPRMTQSVYICWRGSMFLGSRHAGSLVFRDTPLLDGRKELEGRLADRMGSNGLMTGACRNRDSREHSYTRLIPQPTFS